jgi:hypothetical protein
MEGLLLCLTPLVDLIKLGNESGSESDRTFRTARSIKAKVSYVSVRIGNQKTAAASVSSVSDRLSSYPFLLLNKLPSRMYPTVNTNLSNPLIYDFYGFPKHFYAQTFQSSFSDEHVSDVEKQLSNAGWTVDRTDRGLDHGLWGRFMLLQHTHTGTVLNCFLDSTFQGSFPPGSTKHSNTLTSDGRRNSEYSFHHSALLAWKFRRAYDIKVRPDFEWAQRSGIRYRCDRSSGTQLARSQ